MYTDTIKIEKGNWTTIYNDVFRVKINGNKLTPEAWGLYVFMSSLPDDWDYTVEGLTHVVNAGSNKVKRILRELENGGLLIREQKQESGRFSKMKYTILNKPKIPLAQNPPAVNPPAVKPPAENEPQLSTNKQNTNKQILKESSNKLNNGNKSENGKAQVNNSISLSLVKKIGEELKIKEFVYNKFYNYYKTRNFKTNDNILIDSGNLKNFLILWNDREQQYNSESNIPNQIKKPGWLDEYVDELKELE